MSSFKTNFILTVPPLENGDRLATTEFERRYAAMPQVKKAELIEGMVHMASPLRAKSHGKPHAQIMTWLGTYEATTPGVESLDNATVRLDADNVWHYFITTLKFSTAKFVAIFQRRNCQGEGTCILHGFLFC